MPSRVVQTYNNICQTCKFFALTVKFRSQKYLPVVYVSRVDLLPKPKEGKITVNMRRIINTSGSFNGIEIALETIINNIKWNNAWIVLLLNSNGWTLVENIFLNSKRKHAPSFVFANCNSSQRGIYVKCIINTATCKSRCN